MKTFFFPSLCLFLFLCIKFDLIYNKKSMLHQNILHLLLFITRKYAIICMKRRPIVQRYIHLSTKIQTFAHKSDSITILHLNQHSKHFWAFICVHSAYKREKYTFINANIKVINTILKVNGEQYNRQTLKCKHYIH